MSDKSKIGSDELAQKLAQDAEFNQAIVSEEYEAVHEFLQVTKSLPFLDELDAEDGAVKEVVDVMDKGRYRALEAFAQGKDEITIEFSDLED